MLYKDYELNRNQISALRSASNGNFDNIEKETLKFLLAHGLIKQTNKTESFFSQDISPQYAITDEGSMFLRFRTKDIIRTWYPHVISSLALLVSIISLYFSLTCGCR